MPADSAAAHAAVTPHAADTAHATGATDAADAAHAADTAARRREVLERLDRELWRFGTANDADDHHCGAEGAELRLAAAAAIRALMEEHPFLAGALPGLAGELESKHIEGFGWSNLVDALAPELAAGTDLDRKARKTP